MVSTSRGEWRWVLVHVSPSNQKVSRVHIFLVSEGTWGTWNRQQAAVCGVSRTEYGCFGTACLETTYNTHLVFCVVCGLTYTATNLCSQSRHTKNRKYWPRLHFSCCSIITPDELGQFFAVFVHNSQTCSACNKKWMCRCRLPGCAVFTFNCESCTIHSPYRAIQQLGTHLPRRQRIEKSSKTAMELMRMYQTLFLRNT